MRYLVGVLFLLMVVPVWAGGEYFASDRQGIIDGLTTETRTRGLSTPGKVRALRVRPGMEKSERIDLQVDGQLPTVRMRIEFDRDSDVLRTASLPLLHELGEALNDPMLMGKDIRIAGHTDSDGSGAYNLDLSLRRAARVAAWLDEHAGVDPGLVEIVGFGENLPLVANSGPSNKQKNRRVEISLRSLGFGKDVLDSGPGAGEQSGGMAW
ncbi:OmpA family protein [Desulfoplanes sp.]